MTLLDNIVQWISECPLLNGNLNVDYLPPDINEYVIELVPTTTVKKKYADGSQVKQMIFYFGSRECYGPDISVNLNNSRFYDEFSKWIDEQNYIGELPNGYNFETLKAEVLSGGYVVEAESDRARYQISCRITYLERI